jgi:CBS domain containing-hemolysin-like protein
MIPVVLLLLAVAATYVGTVEAAFSALMKLSLRLVAERSGRHDPLGRFLDNPILLFLPARLLLGLIFALVSALVAAELGAFTLRSLGLLLLALATFILVCEHLVPQLIVGRNPEAVLAAVLPSFVVVARVLEPVTRVLARLGTRRERPGSPPPETEDEPGEVAHAYLEAGEQEGLIERDERRLLQSIVDFGDTLVREVMTPRPDIVAITVGATTDELRALFREQEYSRIPVYRETLDNILGFVYLKDILLLEGGAERSIESLLRPAHFVPETKQVADLLKEFQRRQIQSAIVVDEYGGTAGLVTLEDLLEEIVGEIRDEYDVEGESVVEESNGTLVVSGKVDIDELADRLGVTIAREGFETVGGYVLSRLGRVPAVGETLEIDDLVVQVLEAERRRVHKVRVRRKLREPVAARESGRARETGDPRQ